MKRFKMQHLFFDWVVEDFDENSPPDWMISKAFKWWWEGYVLKLKVGSSIESDFQRITRIE